MKRPTGTRWSAKHDAIRALHSSLPTILTVLNSFLSEISNQKDESKATAKGLIKKLCQFDNIFMLVFWKNVLSKMNRANLALQSPNLTLCVVVKLYRSLISFLEDLRTQFDSVFDESKDLPFRLTLFERAPLISKHMTHRIMKKNIGTQFFCLSLNLCLQI